MRKRLLNKKVFFFHHFLINDGFCLSMIIIIQVYHMYILSL